jgi:hypothetical protein
MQKNGETSVKNRSPSFLSRDFHDQSQKPADLREHLRLRLAEQGVIQDVEPLEAGEPAAAPQTAPPPHQDGGGASQLRWPHPRQHSNENDLASAAGGNPVRYGVQEHEWRIRLKVIIASLLSGALGLGACVSLWTALGGGEGASTQKTDSAVSAVAAPAPPPFAAPTAPPAKAPDAPASQSAGVAPQSAPLMSTSPTSAAAPTSPQQAAPQKASADPIAKARAAKLRAARQAAATRRAAAQRQEAPPHRETGLMQNIGKALGGFGQSMKKMLGH